MDLCRGTRVRLILLALLGALVIGRVRELVLANLLLRLENLTRLREWIGGSRAWAPLACIVGYVLAVVACVTGLPITRLGGLAFSPIWGTVYVLIAATAGGCLALVIALLRGAQPRRARAGPVPLPSPQPAAAARLLGARPRGGAR